MKSLRILVSGVVQDVWYRDSLRRRAEELGVVGWVRNLSDGRVEAQLQGPADQVEKCLDYARSGPPRAKVNDVQMTEAPQEDCQHFEISADA